MTFHLRCLATLSAKWPAKQRGMSLVELMVALVTGLTLSGAVVLIYANSKHAFSVQDATAKIQENGRFALHILKQDVRMAGYWGLNYLPATIDSAENVVLDNECHADWSTLVLQPISRSNNTHSGYTNCIPGGDYGAGPQGNGTDILTVRRASGNAVPDAEIRRDHLYLRASLTSGVIFIADTDGAVDSGAAVAEAPVRNYELLAHAYYIRPWSQTRGDNIPTLTRETISGNGVVAEPLVEYVEDFQISFGLDTDMDGNVDRYDGKKPAAGTDPAAGNGFSADDVMTVVVELLVRAPSAEADYINTRTYNLGDSGDFTPADRIRRQVFRETIFVRNRSGPGSV